ncbi:MAG: pilin, partial [Minisyncoccia bacterium]
MTFKKYLFLILSLIVFINVSPFLVSATTTTSTDVPYTTLSGPIPEVAPSGQVTSLGTFLPAVFKLGIGIASALSVIYIIVGGIQYLSTDAIDKKGDGKDKINNALFGLILAISAYTILNTINPKLVNLSLKIDTLPQGGAISTDIVDVPEASSTPRATGCSACDVMPAQDVIPSKTAAQGGCAGSGPCVVDGGLRNKLYTLNQKIKSITPR